MFCVFFAVWIFSFGNTLPTFSSSYIRVYIGALGYISINFSSTFSAPQSLTSKSWIRATFIQKGVNRWEKTVTWAKKWRILSFSWDVVVYLYSKMLFCKEKIKLNFFLKSLLFYKRFTLLHLWTLDNYNKYAQKNPLTSVNLVVFSQFLYMSFRIRNISWYDFNRFYGWYLQLYGF